MTATRILLLGDLILDVPEPDHWLSGIAPILQGGDVVIGHLEVPYTHCTDEVAGDVPAPGANPDHLGALARAGVTAVSMAGNHMMDCGAQGLADTLAGLDVSGIAHAGAGKDLAMAKAPAMLKAGERTIALLSYNCVGPELSWAGPDSAGCAYIRVTPEDGSPSRPQADLRHIDPVSQAEMVADIQAAKMPADLVIVALHKGITHRPAELAPYERPLAAAAVAAGADVVIGHHAHIARGMEWQGKAPVFHGLGNGCVVTHALSPSQDHPARAEWVERRKKMFGFEPDPAYFLAPFHPEAVNGMIGEVTWHEDGRLEANIIPIWFAPPGRPEPAGDTANAIMAYFDEIGQKAGLPPLDLAPGRPNSALTIKAADRPLRII